jgi:zinc and cadmium transporter
MTIFVSIILSSFFISLLSFSGGILLVWKKLLSKTIVPIFVSFAAGVMLTTSLIDLLPEMIHKNAESGIFLSVLAGILVFFFMERFVLWFHHHDNTHHAKPSVYLVLLGDGLHNFFDGIAIAATFLTNPTAGITTTIAIAAHEIPQEIGDLSILIFGGLTPKIALFYNFLSALTALAGAILGYYYLQSFEGILPWAIGFVAGMFLYIACSDLIPELHKEFKEQKRWAQSIPFILGIIITYFLVTFLEH